MRFIVCAEEVLFTMYSNPIICHRKDARGWLNIKSELKSKCPHSHLFLLSKRVLGGRGVCVGGRGGG